MAEFLPLCDLLFNVVSVAAYFCDFAFDILVVYELYSNGAYQVHLVQCVTAIVLAALVTQALSLHWYLKRKLPPWLRLVLILMHLLQVGVLWRYARLLMPVQLSTVKRDVRDLCILRLVHGFVQAAPMLLLQLSILPQDREGAPDAKLLAVSAALSLFSVCWALASFSKHVQSVERLVLTWLGVVSQLLWRAGTVTARALALSAYVASYHSWIFLVLALHWACMFLWLLSPRSPFHGQRGAKLGVCALMAAIYILAYVNLQEKPHTRTMTIFYVVMLLENSILVGAWVGSVWYARPVYWQLVPVLTVLLFGCGIVFMLLYYRYFHVRRLLTEKTASGVAAAATTTAAPPAGVFNCRFAANPSSAAAQAAAAAQAQHRKKKMPTSFVPPPPPPPLGVVGHVPFWRRPLPSSSENEGSSAGSRVNIHQKLQEKKQKQLAELKIIEEEIKQGKLVGPEGADLDDRQPIPRTKRHVEPHLLSLASLNNLASYGVNLNRRPPPRAPRSRTPELLLAPRYLYCDCIAPPQPEPSPGPHAPSDLESQVSLPRSYTLPREFKYYRRQRAGRIPIQTVASTNSSDGDVDSADDESDCNPPPPALIRPLRRPFRHETKL